MKNVTTAFTCYNLFFLILLKIEFFLRNIYLINYNHATYYAMTELKNDYSNIEAELNKDLTALHIKCATLLKPKWREIITMMTGLYEEAEANPDGPLGCILKGEQIYSLETPHEPIHSKLKAFTESLDKVTVVMQMFVTRWLSLDPQMRRENGQLLMQTRISFNHDEACDDGVIVKNMLAIMHEVDVLDKWIRA